MTLCNHHREQCPDCYKVSLSLSRQSLEADARAEKAEAAEARAHAAIASNDERHAEAIAAVRARAEKAEHRLADLETTCAAAEDMRDKADAEALRLRKLAVTVGRLIAANDRASILAPRPDIAWRDVRKAYADIEAADAPGGAS